MATTTSSALLPRQRYGSILLAAGKAIALSIVVDVALYYVLAAAGLIDPAVAVTPNGDTIDSPAPVVFSLLAFLSVATIVFLLLVRFTRNPGRIFTWIAVAGFIASLANPFLVPGIPVAMAIGLNILHVAPAYIVWRFLTRSVA